MKILQKIEIVSRITCISIMALISIGFILYPIIHGIRYWGFEVPKIRANEGILDYRSINASTGWCDYTYHIQKTPYQELPQWCQDYKVKYENYKPVGIIPQ